MHAVADPILVRLRSALDALYGERLERVVLFGSRGRGDARPDSDYDIAVFIKDMQDRWSESDRLAPIVSDIAEDTGAFVHAMPYPAGAWNDRSPPIQELRIEGADIPREGEAAVKPETQAFLDKAKACLSFAETNLSVGLANDAGPNAHMAAFHAAQALIFERCGRSDKTHQGVQGEFGRLTKDDQTIPVEVRRFLSHAYELKALADYEIGPGSILPPGRAADALDRARVFVASVETVLSPPA